MFFIRSCWWSRCGLRLGFALPTLLRADVSFLIPLSPSLSCSHPIFKADRGGVISSISMSRSNGCCLSGSSCWRWPCFCCFWYLFASVVAEIDAVDAAASSAISTGAVVAASLLTKLSVVGHQAGKDGLQPSVTFSLLLCAHHQGPGRNSLSPPLSSR